MGQTPPGTRSAFCAFLKNNQARDVDVIKTRSYKNNSKIKYWCTLGEAAQGALTTAAASVPQLALKERGSVRMSRTTLHSADRVVLGLPDWGAARMEQSGEIFQEDR